MMKAISLWQPWASALVTTHTALGDYIRPKTYETRSWSTSYRGELLICAAKKWSRELGQTLQYDLTFLVGWECPFIDDKTIVHVTSIELNDPADRQSAIWTLPLGYALGVVDLVDCVPTRLLHGQVPEWEWMLGDYAPGRFAWKTENLRMLERPIPITGAQGLFAIDEDLESRIRASLIRTCRRCGCTDARACKGGCSWASIDICTACMANERKGTTT